MMNKLQNLGRALMLPVAVLPAAAILVGLGNWFSDLIGWEIIGDYMQTAGTAILDNLGMLFAVGIAIGLSKDKHGSAALSGIVGFLVVTNLLSMESVADLQNIGEGSVNEAFEENENVFIGILTGIITAQMYNRFSGVRLPDALAFFSGKRLAPIMSAAAMALVGVLLLFVWPIVFSWLVAFGEAISNLGATGAGLYGFFNRLLIPTGLHHALNNVFWFDTAGISDIDNFLSGDGTKGITGRYQAGFFPIMMFGVPAAALAMMHTAKSQHKKNAASLLMAAAFASFLTGVTEPLEFSFMFLAPALYVVHAFLTGLSMFTAAFFHWTNGFGFSAGFVDYTLNFFNGMANKPWMLLVQGLVFGVIYYFLFRFLIVTFNFKTPGREEQAVGEVAGSDSGQAGTDTPTDNKNKDAVMAEQIYDGLGGSDNVNSFDYCTTRLRIDVDDTDNVDQDKIKAAGLPGVNVTGKQSVQVVVGTNVQFVSDEMQKLHTDEKNE